MQTRYAPMADRWDHMKYRVATHAGHVLDGHRAVDTPHDLMDIIFEGH
jgi:hypothetical protein